MRDYGALREQPLWAEVCRRREAGGEILRSDRTGRVCAPDRFIPAAWAGNPASNARTNASRRSGSARSPDVRRGLRDLQGALQGLLHLSGSIGIARAPLVRRGAASQSQAPRRVAIGADKFGTKRPGFRSPCECPAAIAPINSSANCLPSLRIGVRVRT
jgi:hypothetical protein